MFGEYSITVTDSYGRIIHQEKGNKEDQIVKNSIDLKNPTEGIYFVNVDNGSMKQLIKLLILK